jgi:hypothetical protein
VYEQKHGTLALISVKARIDRIWKAENKKIKNRSIPHPLPSPFPAKVQGRTLQKPAIYIVNYHLGLSFSI